MNPEDIELVYTPLESVLQQCEAAVEWKLYHNCLIVGMRLCLLSFHSVFIFVPSKILCVPKTQEALTCTDLKERKNELHAMQTLELLCRRV